MAPFLSYAPSAGSYFHAPHLDTDLTTVLVVSTFLGFGLLLLMAAKLMFCDFAQNRRARKRVAAELSAGRFANLEGGRGGCLARCGARCGCAETGGEGPSSPRAAEKKAEHKSRFSACYVLCGLCNLLSYYFHELGPTVLQIILLVAFACMVAGVHELLDLVSSVLVGTVTLLMALTAMRLFLFFPPGSSAEASGRAVPGGAGGSGAGNSGVGSAGCGGGGAGAGSAVAGRAGPGGHERHESSSADTSGSPSKKKARRSDLTEDDLHTAIKAAQSCPDLEAAERSSEARERWPGVTLLKPCCGADDTHLEANLESAVKIGYSYPKLEIIFCVGAAEDPARFVIQKVLARHPTVDARMMVGMEAGWPNPKMANIAKAVSVAKYDRFWFQDANIRTSDCDLRALVARIRDPRVGMVHQLPWMRSTSGDLYTSLERCYFAGVHQRMYLLVNQINGNGLVALCGMSFMTTRVSFEAIGGCHALKDSHSEDGVLGVKMVESGYRSYIVRVPLVQNPPVASLQVYLNRRFRWQKVRAHGNLKGVTWLVPFEMFIEYAFYLPLLISLVYHNEGMWAAIALTPIVVALACALDCGVARRLDRASLADQGKPTKSSFLHFFGAWCLTVTIPVYLVFRGLVSRDWAWRGNKVDASSSKQEILSLTREFSIGNKLDAV